MAQDGRFHTTRWTLVLSAAQDDDADAQAALAELCGAYWYPVYAFVRRRGHPPDAARDLTQAYFLKTLERRDWAAARPERGRFRSFLLSSLKHFLANTRRDSETLKRGGHLDLVSLDVDSAEGRFQREPTDGGTPEAAYERLWALAVIERVRGRVRDELELAGRLDSFEALSPFVFGADEVPTYAETAERLDTSEAGARMAATRLRRHFGRALREEIGQTVEAGQVDDEIRHLMATLRER